MKNLIRAGIRRYTHNIVFWLSIVFTVVVSIISAKNAREFYFDDFYCVLTFFAFAVLISWIVGRENDEGIFRNKVVSGHTKGQIYVSELILGVGACLILFLLFATVFIAFNWYVFTKASLSVLIRIFLDSMLVNICFAIILVTLSCIITKRYIVAIVNIILVLALIFASYTVQSIVEQDEYFIEYEYEDKVVTDEFGTHIQQVEIEGSEHKVKNPKYIDGFARDICEVLYDILPYGHMTEYTYITNDWFGYDYYSNFPEMDVTWETSKKDLTVTKEVSNDITENLIWSILVSGIICAVGYVIVRKKDIK